MDNPSEACFRPALDGFRWDGVDRLAYKEEGSALFKAISRQVLFADPELACELRYFEIAPGGFSTLERHRHVHAVMILRGHGWGLVGTAVRPVVPHDLITVPPLTWHQFRAGLDEALGFLCMVNARRDRPELPAAPDLEALRALPAVSAFLDLPPASV
jgi:quercetin dioxygenase-like cupin family protein